MIETLADLFLLRGVPAHIRVGPGPEFIAQVVKDWISAVGAQTACIERGSPWENGYVESFNARLRWMALRTLPVNRCDAQGLSQRAIAPRCATQA